MVSESPAVLPSIMPERPYFIKAYVCWWLVLALLGSFWMSGFSHSFLHAIWNPLAWNIAGAVAFVIAMVQAHHRHRLRDALNRFRSYPGVKMLLMAFYLWIMGGNSLVHHAGQSSSNVLVNIISGLILVTAVISILTEMVKRNRQPVVSTVAPSVVSPVTEPPVQVQTPVVAESAAESTKTLLVSRRG